jgi:hypothetical protein
MRVTRDVGLGAWIRPRLEGWGVVGGTVPRGYDAYARVLHPSTISELRGALPDGGLDVVEEPITWAEVAALRGTRFHPAAQWAALAGSPDQIPLGRDRYLNPPREGQLELPAFTALARILLAQVGSTPVVIGVWNGWGDLRTDPGGFALLLSEDATPVDREEAERALHAELAARGTSEAQRVAERGPWLELPGREYVLLEGDLAELGEESWVWSSGLGWHRSAVLPGAGLTPNLLWPADRSWCVATEIDFDSTLVGGSRALVDAVIADLALDAVEVDPDTDLTWDGDTVDPRPPR